LAVNIRLFTGTKGWSSDNYKTTHFVGLQSDIDFAVWLTETLTHFVQRELKNYIWSNHLTGLRPGEKRIVINGFIFGCCRRINDRLRELHEGAKTSDNKNALVVIVSKLIDDKMNEMGMTDLKAGRSRTSRINEGAWKAGKAAGDRASFGRPVGGAAGVLRIGRA